MKFERLLEDLRHRAGLPVKEQLQDPESEEWMRRQRENPPALALDDKQVVELSQILKRIQAAAQRGYKETKHSGYKEILQAMGVLRESLSEAWKPREPDYEVVTLEFIDEETGEISEAEVRAFYEVEPTEYEGQYEFYRGGLRIEGIEFENDFQFGGKVYQRGQEFPDELLDNVVAHGGRSIHTGVSKGWGALEDHVAELIYAQADISVPTRRYPDQRFVGAKWYK